MTFNEKGGMTMDEPYINFLHGLQKLLHEFYECSNTEQSLMESWLRMNDLYKGNFDKNYLDTCSKPGFRNLLEGTFTLADLEKPWSIPKKEIFQLLQTKYLSFQPIDDSTRENYQFFPRLLLRYQPTLCVLRELHCKRQLRENARDIIQEELLNVFFRLTRYPSGSLVPLRDLIDSSTAQRFFGGQNIWDSELKWKLAIEGIFFSLKRRQVSFPAPYHFQFSVLERTDELNKALLELEEAYLKIDLKIDGHCKG